MKFALALGGGGARGSAHIGAIREMQKIGLCPPTLITGTSIGGYIGALLCAGYDLETIERHFSKLSLGSLVSVPTKSAGLFNTTKGEGHLVKILGRINFEQLQIPLAVVTVDLISRREIVLDNGDLVSAIMATTALPIVAPPVERNGMMLIDGGVLNNVPFDVARARGATHVVAIDLSHSAPYGTPTPKSATSPPGLLGRALAVTQRRPLWQVVTSLSDIIAASGVRARLAIAPPDILIQPDIGTIGLVDFYRMADGIHAGILAAQAVAIDLQKLKEQLDRLTSHR